MKLFNKIKSKLNEAKNKIDETTTKVKEDVSDIKKSIDDVKKMKQFIDDIKDNNNNNNNEYMQQHTPYTTKSTYDEDKYSLNNCEVIDVEFEEVNTR